MLSTDSYAWGTLRGGNCRYSSWPQLGTAPFWVAACRKVFPECSCVHRNASQCIAFPIFFRVLKHSQNKKRKCTVRRGGVLVEKSLRFPTFFGGICELICKGLGGCEAKERYLRGNVCIKDGEKAVPRASVDATLCDSAPLKRENPELDAWTPRILGSDKARRTHCMALQQRLGKQKYIQMLDLLKELRALFCDLEVGRKR